MRATEAYFMQIVTKAGRKFGLTSLDHDIVIAGDNYISAGGIEPTASNRQIGGSIDSGNIKVLINNPVLTPEIMRSGVLEDAAVTIVILDWLAATGIDDGIVVISGIVGEISETDTSFSFEILSTSHRLNKGLTYTASPVCPFEFGGVNCGLNLSTTPTVLRRTGIILSAVNTFSPIAGEYTTLNVDPGITSIPSEFSGGTLTYTSGDNLGLTVRLLFTDTGFILRVPITYISLPQNGDTFEIVANCNKTKEACIGYGNFNRFGGFLVGFGVGSSQANWMVGLAKLQSANIDF